MGVPALAACNAAVAAGVEPEKAIMEGLAAGMAEMGRLVRAGGRIPPSPS